MTTSTTPHSVRTVPNAPCRTGLKRNTWTMPACFPALFEIHTNHYPWYFLQLSTDLSSLKLLNIQCMCHTSMNCQHFLWNPFLHKLNLTKKHEVKPLGLRNDSRSHLFLFNNYVQKKNKSRGRRSFLFHFTSSPSLWLPSTLVWFFFPNSGK